MNTDAIVELLAISQRKKTIDSRESCLQGAETYFEEIRKELEEVQEELKSGKTNYLEDELGDVFWDYLNLLNNLESEGRITLTKVFERARDKYEERISGLEQGLTWDEVKKRQKARLANEHEQSQDF